MGRIDSNSIVLNNNNNNNNNKRNSNNSGGRAVLLWKALQGVILILLLLNLKKTNTNNPTTCPPSASPIQHQPSASSSNLRSELKSTTRSSSSSLYTTPVSARVPAQGIDTILATSRTSPPFHFFAYPRTVDLVTANLIKTGIYEQDSTTALIDAIVCNSHDNNNNNNKKQQYVTLDLGANIGFHSLHMAACEAKVISFEASPDTAWLLTSSARLNQFHDVTVIPRGASNVTSVGRLSRHADSPGMTSFIDHPQAVFDKMETPLQGTALDFDIPMVRAQDVLQDLLKTTTPIDKQQQQDESYQLRLVKMDVEGFEYQALQGLDLKNQYPFEYLTLEFFPALLSAAGTEPVSLLTYIWSQGYRYLEFDSHKELSTWKHVGGDTEESVRQWGQQMLDNGVAQDGKNFHTNLLAKRLVSS